MGTTSLGFEYADSTDHTRIWEHLQDTAESINDYLATRGRVGTNTRTSASSGVTTTETTIDSVTAALVSGRTYRIRWNAAIKSSVAGDTVFVRLREDNTAGTQMNIIRVECPATGGSGTRYLATIEAEYTAGSTGNKTFVGTIVRASGTTGSYTVEADTTYPVLLTVDYVSG